MSQLITYLLDDSLFDNVKNMIAAKEDLACPKCKSYMMKHDFNRKTRFYVNKCISCGSIWLNPMQIPLVCVAFIENTPEDLNFKETINNIYKTLAKKNAKKVRSFDEVMAPYAVISGLLPSIPMGDNILTKTKPLITRSIIYACAVVFVLQLFLSSKMLSIFALYPDRALDHFELYRLITYAFLHGNIFHILGNMLFLNAFGKAIEDELGWAKYLLLFAVGAIVSGALFMATTAKKDIPCIGASGAISAIMGAYLIMFPKARLRFNVVNPITFQKVASSQVSALSYILAWIVMNMLFGMFQTGKNVSGVAYWGHIGGFIAGIVFIEIYKNIRRV